jgi:hypothetical protein
MKPEHAAAHGKTLCNSMDAGMVPELGYVDCLARRWPYHDMTLQRVPSIINKQENSVFLALEAPSGNPNEIASSLVFGNYFIHGYEFGIWDKGFLAFCEHLPGMA